MFQLVNQYGDELFLSSDQKLQLEIVSALFSDDEDVLVGSKSLPMRVVINENTRRFLRSKDQYFSSEFADIPVTLNAEGLTLYRCLLSYKVNNNTLDMYLKIDLGELANQIKSITLRSTITERVQLANYATLHTRMLEIASAAPGVYPITFFPLFNDNFIEKEFAYPESSNVLNLQRGFVNYWQPDEGRFLCDGTAHEYYHGYPPVAGTKYIVGSPVVPFVYFKYVLLKVCEYLGLRAFGPILDDVDFNRLVFDNNRNVVTNWSGAQPFVQNTVLVNEHVPDITISEFLKGLRTYFGLGTFINTSMRSVLFKTAKEMCLDRDYVEIENSIADQTIIDQQKSEGVSVEVYEGNNEIFKEISIKKSEKVGDGNSKVTLKIGTLPVADRYANPYFLKVPVSKSTGNVTGTLYKESGHYFKEGVNTDSVPFNLLFYHGVRQGKRADTPPYPQASSLSRDDKEIRVTQYSLWPNEPDNIYNYYQGYLFELNANTRMITSFHLMSLTQIAQLVPEKKIGAKLDGLTLSKFFLKSKNFELPIKDGKIRVRLQMIPLKPISLGASQTNLQAYDNTWIEIRFVATGTMTDTQDVNTAIDIWVFFWQDSQKTVPQNVTNLAVVVSTEVYESEIAQNGISEEIHICNGLSQKLITNFLRHEVFGSNYVDRTVYINETLNYHVINA